MEYARLAAVYSELEKTPGKLKKAEIIAALLRECPGEELASITRLLRGRVFPPWSDKEIGIATQLMIKTIASSTGFPEKEIEGEYRRSGDLGLVAEKLVSEKKQATLFQRKLTTGKVFENLRSLAEIGGKGSQSRKFQLVSEILSSASPLEVKYIVRTVLGDLRVGVAEGTVRDSIARAFFPDSEGDDLKEAVKAVEWAWFLRPDYGEVAVIARDSGLEGLKKVKLKVGEPYMVQLSEKSPGLEAAMQAYEDPALEFKYDGARLSMHKSGEAVKLFTRRLEDVTRQFPEVVEMVRKSVMPKKCIIEGEMVGIGKDGRPLAFQYLSQRIKRKYDIEKVMAEIPVKIKLFDIVLLEGRVLFDRPQKERWETLNKVVKPVEGKFSMADHLETRDLKEAERFYRRALSGGNEGLIIKNKESTYQPGRRVAGGWLKVKPVMENLDLVITGGTWGTGKRVGWLGSMMLGCRDSDGEYRDCGMIGTGIKEKGDQGGVTFDTLTRLLKPHIQEEKGSSVRIRPKVVVEVAYEEIQRSPNYSSGYALRFPRVVRIRDDRRAEDSDSIDRIEALYKKQRHKK